MIRLHHLENSRSQRILWLMEELALDYEIVRYERDPVTMLGPDSLMKIHPLGKSPVLEDGKHTIAESGAIIEYLISHHADGKLIPASDSDNRLDYTYWLHYAEGSLMPLLLLQLVFERFAHPPMPLLMRPVAALIGKGVKAKMVTPRLRQHFAFVDQRLGESRWFAGGRLTGADIQMSFPLEAAASRGVTGADGPNIAKFLERIRARPAYKRALDRGGPYTYS